VRGVGVSRRSLLIGGCLSGVGLAGLGGVALVDRGALPGQGRLNRALGRCDVSVPAADASPPAGPVVRGVFDSARRRCQVNYTIGYPPGPRPGDPLPVCLLLHGYGGDASSSPVSPYLASSYLASSGLPPFALAAMDGGGGYWHPHALDDPLGALLDEFLPLLASRGLVTDRVAVLGWSMGGYGALLCGITQPARFAAVVASSPAIWRSYAEARGVNAGAFDSAAEWARYDLLARAGELRGLRVRVDCGEHDTFAPAVRALRAKLPDPSVVHLAKGCHDDRFWQHVAPEQLRFVGEALASAKRT
jgi:S-formylglutathione hydrolase FrmB